MFIYVELFPEHIPYARRLRISFDSHLFFVPDYISARFLYPCADFGSLFGAIIRLTVVFLLNM